MPQVSLIVATFAIGFQLVVQVLREMVYSPGQERLPYRDSLADNVEPEILSVNVA